MSYPTVVLQALGSQPVSTSDLYDRVGYLALARAGLVPYAAFRAELAALVADGRARCETAPDGSTLWWRPEDRHDAEASTRR